MSAKFNKDKMLEAMTLILGWKPEVDFLKCLKLLIIAERESWAKWSYPIVGGVWKTSPFGPIILETCSYADNFERIKLGVQSYKPAKLCEADIDILKGITYTYAPLLTSELIQVTIDWDMPSDEGFYPLGFILESLGIKPEDIKFIEDQVEEEKHIYKLFKGTDNE